jgi:hypothetical protein
VIVFAVLLVLAGLIALAVLASVVPFGWAGIFLVATLAVIVFASGGDHR